MSNQQTSSERPGARISPAIDANVPNPPKSLTTDQEAVRTREFQRLLFADQDREA